MNDKKLFKDLFIPILLITIVLSYYFEINAFLLGFLVSFAVCFIVYVVSPIVSNLIIYYKIRNEAFRKISHLDVSTINLNASLNCSPKWEWIPEEPTEFTYDNYDITFDPEGINLNKKNYENHYRFIPKTDVKGLEQGGDVLYVELINHDDVFLTFDSIEECKSKVKEIQQLFYKANNEQLFDPFTSHCKRCGCSWNNACEGGCYWFDEWICSSCATDEELK